MGTLDLRSGDGSTRLERKRRLVADLCRMLDPKPSARHSHPPGDSFHRGPNGNGRVYPGVAPDRTPADLSPRLRQTLDRLLAGDSEKEIAFRFGRSRHTVHVYVKKLYQRFGVSSRGELFARFVRGPAAAADRKASPE